MVDKPAKTSRVLVTLELAFEAMSDPPALALGISRESSEDCRWVRWASRDGVISDAQVRDICALIGKIVTTEAVIAVGIQGLLPNL
jgi:hypothetical protein